MTSLSPEAPLDDVECGPLPPVGATASVDTGWIADFGWRGGRIEFRKTGHRVAVDAHFFAELFNWLVYLALLAVVAGWARLRRRNQMTIWYAPDRPRPWYLMRGAALWAGIGAAHDEPSADAAVYFDDATSGQAPASRAHKRLNFGCVDVSKSRVAQVFEETFGYPLAVDPAAVDGPIVEKSEVNGAHDGRVVRAPLRRRPGYVYQRLIETGGGGLSQDLRTPCVGGAPVVVWIKAKPSSACFAIHNRRAVLRDPAEVFSPAELAAIRRFNDAMGLDWGGLDILRDRADGRIYVVDVNKTDLGPVIALSWRDKIVSMQRLAAALALMVAGG
jgi:hypothetical protein